MELVVDANVLFSALIARDGKTRELLMTSGLSLFMPEFVLDEFNKHLSELSDKTQLTKETLTNILRDILVYSNLRIVPLTGLKSTLVDADSISPDPDDVQYFALALKLRCGIWSNDKKLKKQRKIKVYSTEDLVKLLADL